MQSEMQWMMTVTFERSRDGRMWVARNADPPHQSAQGDSPVGALRELRQCLMAPPPDAASL